MHTYNDLIELARICIRQAKSAADPTVKEEFMKLAHEYQSRAAKLDSGILPDIGDEAPDAAHPPPVSEASHVAQQQQQPQRPMGEDGDEH